MPSEFADQQISSGSAFGFATCTNRRLAKKQLAPVRNLCCRNFLTYQRGRRYHNPNRCIVVFSRVRLGAKILNPVLVTIVDAFVPPVMASAATISSTFKSSSSVTESKINVRDTITPEVTVLVPTDSELNTGRLSTAGDSNNATNRSVSNRWPGVRNIVFNWERHDSIGSLSATGGSKVKFGENRRLVPQPTNEPAGPSRRRSHVYGVLSGATVKTGDGIRALVGTITITADYPGALEAGAYLHPQVDLWRYEGLDIVASFSGASFTVVGDPPGDPAIAPTSDQHSIGFKSARIGGNHRGSFRRRTTGESSPEQYCTGRQSGTSSLKTNS